MHAHCPTGYVQPHGARPPCAAWLQDRSRAHSTESSRQADRRGGHLLCPPPQTKAGSFGQASTWPQVLGVQRTERCQHSGSQQCRVSLRYVFSAPRDPWGSWLERTLGMPEAWPGRVRALSTQPLPRKWGLWASGGGGGGGEGRSALGASLGSSTQGGGSECRGPAPCSSWCWEQPPHQPRRGRGCGGQRGRSAVSVMRSQESGRGSPRQSLEWVGRRGRKVLHVWVSGQGQGPRAGRVGKTVESRVGSSTGPRLPAPEEGR